MKLCRISLVLIICASTIISNVNAQEITGLEEYNEILKEYLETSKEYESKLEQGNATKEDYEKLTEAGEKLKLYTNTKLEEDLEEINKKMEEQLMDLVHTGINLGKAISDAEKKEIETYCLKSLNLTNEQIEEIQIIEFVDTYFEKLQTCYITKIQEKEIMIISNNILENTNETRSLINRLETGGTLFFIISVGVAVTLFFVGRYEGRKSIQKK